MGRPRYPRRTKVNSQLSLPIFLNLPNLPHTLIFSQLRLLAAHNSPQSIFSHLHLLATASSRNHDFSQLRLLASASSRNHDFSHLQLCASATSRICNSVHLQRNQRPVDNLHILCYNVTVSRETDTNVNTQYNVKQFTHTHTQRPVDNLHVLCYNVTVSRETDKAPYQSNSGGGGGEKNGRNKSYPYHQDPQGPHLYHRGSPRGKSRGLS